MTIRAGAIPEPPWAIRAALAIAIGLLLVHSGLSSAAVATADDDWIGKKTGAKTPSSRPASSLLGSAIAVPGLKGNEVVLEASKILPQMRFSTDGKHVFILDESGSLRKLTFPDMAVAGELPINSRCSSFCEAGPGLLVVLDGKEELWVIDPQTLSVSRQFKIGRISRIAAGAKSYIGWARLDVGGTNELAAVDLRSGKVVRQARMTGWGVFPKRYPRPGQSLDTISTWLSSVVDLATTSNGQFLIVSESQGLFCRYLCQGTTLVPQEAQWSSGTSDDTPFVISGDDKYVSVWYRCRRVYKLTDFSKPVIEGEPSPHPWREVFAFDRLGQKLYAGGTDNPTLWTINLQGRIEKQYHLGHPAGKSLQILAHPDGGKLLVLTERKLYRVEPVEAEGISVASRPADGGKPPAGKVATFAGGKVTSLAGLPSRRDVGPRDTNNITGWGCWSLDGKAFFWLDKVGRLSRVERDGYRISVRAAFPHPPRWLYMSASGLVTYSLGAQELLVIDPATLETRQAIPIPADPQVTSMAASPALAKVLLYFEPDNTLQWVDLRRGPGNRFGVQAIQGLARIKWPNHMILPGLDAKALGQHLSRRLFLSRPALTPDGKYLFTRGISEFEVSGEQLVIRAFHPVDIGAHAGPVVSQDSLYVSMPGTRLPAASLADLRPAVIAWGVIGFPRQVGAVQTLQSPFQLDLGVRHKAYAIVKDKTLTVCDLAAGKSRDVPLPENGWVVKAHPRDNAVLVAGEDHLLFVDFDPDQGAATTQPKEGAR